MLNASDINPVCAHDIDVLARTIYGEARGEALDGQIAVGFVILHRAEIAHGWCLKHGKAHPLYGDGSLASACMAPKQFSCWNVGNPNRLLSAAVGLGDLAFNRASYAAHAVIQGQVDDRLPGATHYLDLAIIKTMPTWLTGVPAHDGEPAIPPAQPLGAVGHHNFYAVPA